MSTDDKRIREFAYQIWESEGKPEGQEERHWEMARKLTDAEAQAKALAPGKSAKTTGSKSLGAKSATGKPDGKLSAKGAEPKARTKAKPAASTMTPLGEKSVEKKPRAARKPPTT